jgi:hypothetical protein
MINTKKTSGLILYIIFYFPLMNVIRLINYCYVKDDIELLLYIHVHYFIEGSGPHVNKLLESSDGRPVVDHKPSYKP